MFFTARVPSQYSDENRLFQKKIAFLSGVGPETFMSPSALLDMYLAPHMLQWTLQSETFFHWPALHRKTCQAASCLACITHQDGKPLRAYTGSAVCRPEKDDPNRGKACIDARGLHGGGRNGHVCYC